MAGVKWLHHRPEILAQTTCLARGDAECTLDFAGVETVQLRTRGRASKDAASARRVKPVLIVARSNGFRQLGFDLDTELIREQQVLAAFLRVLGHGEGGG